MNNWFKILLSIAMLGGAGVILWHALQEDDRLKPVKFMYYYDLNTKKRFVSGVNDVPPIVTESGPTPDGEPAGVRARVYGCGSCDEDKLFIGMLEKYTEEARKSLEGDSSDHVAALSGIRVAHPDRLEWVEPNGGKARQIKIDAAEHCPKGVRAQPCYPSRLPESE